MSVRHGQGPSTGAARAWRDVSDCAIGHGIGLHNQEAPTITPLFSIENPITFEENMVIAIETFYGSKPGELPRQGARIEDLVVVMKDGYENLARWPEDKITECWI